MLVVNLTSLLLLLFPSFPPFPPFLPLTSFPSFSLSLLPFLHLLSLPPFSYLASLPSLYSLPSLPSLAWLPFLSCILSLPFLHLLKLHYPSFTTSLLQLVSSLVPCCLACFPSPSYIPCPLPSFPSLQLCLISQKCILIFWEGILLNWSSKDTFKDLKHMYMCNFIISI